MAKHVHTPPTSGARVPPVTSKGRRKPTLAPAPAPRGSPGTLMPLPPKTPMELALENEITSGLRSIADRLHQRNLDNAVLLAQMAARQEGELVSHFAELGRRFSDLLNRPQRRAARGFKVIDGGAA